MTVLLSFSFASADEGFSSAETAVPAVIKTAWDATVRVEKQFRYRSASLNRRIVGSGVIVGYNPKKHVITVITNAHVAGCNMNLVCTYRLLNGASTSATQSYKDYPQLDLTVLYFEWTGSEPPAVATLSNDMDAMPIGSEIMAIGYPNLGLRNEADWKVPRPADFNSSIKRFSEGYILRMRQHFYPTDYPYLMSETDEPLETVSLRLPFAIIHDADTLKGNSGGPLVNSKGEVIGLNTGVIRPKEQGSNRDYCRDNRTCYYYTVPSPVIIKALSSLR